MHKIADQTPHEVATGKTDITIRPTERSRINDVDLDAPGFGAVFSDHMASVDYKDGAWQNPEIVPYGNIEVSPSMCSLHYGQAIFEGMKAFPSADGNITIFRPQAHHERFNRSSDRMCIPRSDYNTFIDSLEQLITLDKDWVPKKAGNALYIRPFIFATDNYLAVKVSETYKFFIITSPVGAYYKEGIKPVSLITAENYVRSVKGGVGDIKTLGNYGASLLPAKKAQEQGFTQVLWLDAIEHRYVEEVGTMNMFFLIENELVTPPLEGTILSGITRDSVIQLAESWGVTVNERHITIDEVMERGKDGSLQEAFGTGTAAVISPVGKIQHRDEAIMINDYEMGPFARRLYNTITGIQYGHQEDTFDWMYTVKRSE